MKHAAGRVFGVELETASEHGASALALTQPNGAAHAEIRTQVQRIVASPFFVRSRRLCRFLHFSVEQTLAGDASCVKEQLVGLEVFDRKPDYDPRVDPIVRVEARRLRAKLKAYYDAAGPADAVRIEFPVGSYAPRFFPFSGGSPAVPEAAGEISGLIPGNCAADGQDTTPSPATPVNRRMSSPVRPPLK